MTRTRTHTRRLARWVVALLATTPLLVLLPWAAADAWRAPALLPQQLGTRGLDVVLAPGSRVLASTANSALVAVVTTAVAVALAWPAARWLSTAPLSRRVPALVVLALPVLVPPLAVGQGLLWWSLRLGIADTRSALVVAHLPAVLPYVVLALAPAFGGRVRDAEEAARTLGARPLQVLTRVTVPMVTPALSVAVLLGGIVSWSQYGTSLAIGGGVPMLPLVLEPFVGRDPQVAAALGIVFLLPALALLVVTVRRIDEDGEPGPIAP